PGGARLCERRRAGRSTSALNRRRRGSQQRISALRAGGHGVGHDAFERALDAPGLDRPVEDLLLLLWRGCVTAHYLHEELGVLDIRLDVLGVVRLLLERDAEILMQLHRDAA